MSGRDEVERVLVVDRAAFFGGNWPQGFTPLDPVAAQDWAAAFEDAARFEPRPIAEETPAWKQPIPYCVVCRGEREVFCVQRLSGQGEARLHGKISIGIGGHVEPIDQLAPGILGRAASRELGEELFLDLDVRNLPPPRCVGILNDDSNAVGSVHVGLVHIVQVPADTPDTAVRVRETTKMRGGFRGVAGADHLWHDAPLLESWSALLLDAIHRGEVSLASVFPGSAPAFRPTPLNSPGDRPNGGAEDAEALS